MIVTDRVDTQARIIVLDKVGAQAGIILCYFVEFGALPVGDICEFFLLLLQE